MLPYISESLPRIHGTIKGQPQDFVVEEESLYEPCGEGEHCYVRLRRSGQTTRAVIQSLARLFNLQDSEIGYAGLKDKQAVATQTFSLPLTHMSVEELSDTIAGALDGEVLTVKRHLNKLKRGHLLGNHFRIILRTGEQEALGKARAIAKMLKARGVANYYGEQRFGHDGTNIPRGRQLLVSRRRARGWKEQLFLSAYQGHLFNQWLAQRIQSGHFTQLRCGDIAKKLDTGGLFEVQDVHAEQARLDRREISYTGPIFGSRMRAAGEEADEFEQKVLASEGLAIADFQAHRLKGSRRVARLFVSDFNISHYEEGLSFEFFLPKGSYATVVLREFLIGS